MDQLTLKKKLYLDLAQILINKSGSVRAYYQYKEVPLGKKIQESEEDYHARKTQFDLLLESEEELKRDQISKIRILFNNMQQTLQYNQKTAI